jgi:hypothetical protein
MREWSDAMRYCDASTWGGYRDWRLPDFYEYMSIFDADHTRPVVDTNRFGVGTAYGFWSSSVYAGNSTQAWVLLVDYGFPMPGNFTGTYSVLCVRTASATWGWGAAERFTRTSGTEPVVADSKTNLVWQGCPAGLSDASCTVGTVTEMNWAAALVYCESLIWNGLSDWRLANLGEHASLIDVTRFAPAIDATAFPAGPYAFFWASTSYADSAYPYAWRMNLARPDYELTTKTNTAYTRCVRGTP